MSFPFVSAGFVPDDETSPVQRVIEEELDQKLTEVERRKLSARRKAEEEIAKLQEETRSVVALRASSFAMRRTAWLWTDRIPMGEVTLIAGRGGTGKSQMLSRLAADVTMGTLPGEFMGKPRAILYVVNEDSIEATVVPRMVAAGANLDLVYFLAVPGGTLTLPRDCERIEARADEVGAACVMLDPLSANLGAKKNDQDQMRTDMQAIRAMCERGRFSVIGLAHTKKAMTNNLMDAILGSTELGNVCRSAMGVMADEAQPGTYILSQEKSNLGRLDVASYRYRIESFQFEYGPEIISTSRVEILEESDVRVSDMLADNMETGNSGKLGEAKDALEQYLIQSGESLKSEVTKWMEKEGYAKRTTERAATRLKVESKTTGFGKERKTTWSLPVKAKQEEQKQLTQ
jgi:hypothetical protein